MKKKCKDGRCGAEDCYRCNPEVAAYLEADYRMDQEQDDKLTGDYEEECRG